MSPIPHISLLPLILSIFFLPLITQLPCGTCATSAQREYERWVNWNVQKHHRPKMKNDNAITSSHSDSKVVPGSKTSRTKVLDLKLENAEMKKTKLVVDQNGNGDYKTITQAIDSVPLHNTKRIVLEIMPGVYREKIHIERRKAFITLHGDAMKPPTITGNDTASFIKGDGTLFTTFQTATVAIDADYFVALNIIFENTATHEVGTAGEQAVALRISGTKAAFYNCSFYGYQDTLYDHKGLHYFHNCFIQGSVDFIFGRARSFYENCTLNSISRKVASLTAQKRANGSMESGFSFKDCRVIGSGMVYLGRAWGDYSRVVFSFTFLDKLVLPQGWSNWGNSNRNSSVYYGEYKCSGPGSNMTGRVPWAHSLADQEAQPFIGPYFVDADSWLISPSTYNY